MTKELTSVIHSAEEVVEISEDGFQVHEDAGVAVVDGEVKMVSDSEKVVQEYPPENAQYSVDASGESVIPGFVDPHTHAVFAGDRSDEFEAKLKGKTYQEIMDEGGGILRTVRAVRNSDTEELASSLVEHLDTMLEHGTTTVEVKSGYGLDTETELRMLEAIELADERHPADIVPTFMGAHAVPPEKGSGEYVEEVVEDQLPQVVEQGTAEFCDVFCEEDVFTVEESRRVLEAGKEHGLKPKIHAEEFTRLGGAQLGAEVGAVSADHLLHANSEDVEALKDGDVTPVFLPGTAFVLGTDYADARSFIDAGADVAVATDFNPNCHSQSMGFAYALACIGMNMTPREALVASTRNAASALDRDGEKGLLTEGATADIAVIDAPSHVHVPYNFGVNLVSTVLKDGEVVCSD